jgi:hypothetical protein
MKIRIRRERKIPDIVTDIQPMSSTAAQRICCSRVTEGKRDVCILRKPYHVELTFQEGGAYLRACNATNTPGLLIPVSGYREATTKAKAFGACIAEKKDVKACAAEMGAKTLGRHR